MMQFCEDEFEEKYTKSPEFSRKTLVSEEKDGETVH